MISIFDYLNYREFLKDWIKSKSNSTKGLQSKLASSARISSTFMSRILSGDKQLTPEQGLEMALFIGLTDKEIDYLLLLLEIGRAGSEKLKQRLEKKAKLISKKIEVRIENTTQLSEETKSVFYSSWIYSGIRNYVATPGPHDIMSISNALNIPKDVTASAIEFLIENGLCKKEKNSITYAVKKTHLDAESHYVKIHHTNWRHKAIQNMHLKKTNDLFFTSPMSLSEETAEEIRSLIPELIQKVMKKVEPSPSEKVYCLNLDWFEV